MKFDFSQTYLYRIHRLTTSLDAIFDTNLRKYANIGLSQFTLLLAVEHNESTTQGHLAKFLGISPGAISRQVEIAQRNKWIIIDSDSADRRKQLISLTDSGQKMIDDGIAALEKHVFQIFDNENAQTNLMHHISMLQENIDAASQR